MPGVVLHMRPEVVALSWDDFRATHAPFSVALDGYVVAGPRFDPDGPYVNFDHHTDVERLATRATCGQVFMALCQGLYDCFCDDDGPRAEVYANDCDEDVCTAWYLLKHACSCRLCADPALKYLVGMADVLDTTAGCHPFPLEMPFLKELAWVYEPYRRFRRSPDYERRDAAAFAGVVADVEGRIGRHVRGEGGRVELDLRYKRHGGGKCWALIEEVGAMGRTGAFADGVRAYVAFRPRDDGRWSYTLGRMSAFVPFDVPKLLRALNAAEGDGDDAWGGSNIVGGSPRVRGSKLPPPEVERVVNEALKPGQA